MNAGATFSPISGKSPDRQQLIGTLRGLLRDAFRLRCQGASAADVCRAQGYADGFMLSLELAGVCTEKELLEIVSQARRGEAGPATRTLHPEADVDCDARIIAA